MGNRVSSSQNKSFGKLEYNTIDTLFTPSKKYDFIVLKHLGYYISHSIKSFFSKPYKEEKKDLDLLDQVSSLLDVSTTNDNIEKCKEFIHLHRIVENTKARRRLEKWSLRVIALYLFIVLSIVILCYSDIPIIGDLIKIKIPDPIMITILSTTTVNIIGLGLIILRGHFLANDKSNNIKDNNE